MRRLGLSASRYEGPTGIVGVLHDACRQAGISSASLWAAVPHYVSLTPSPKAALALSERLADLLGAEIDTSELAEASENYAEQVSEAVASDPDTAAYIEELEQRADTLAEEADLPSGDALAAELTRFLREQDDGATTTTRRSPAGSSPSALAEREGVGPNAGAEAQLEQAAPQRLEAGGACRGGFRRRARSAAACRRGTRPPSRGRRARGAPSAPVKLRRSRAPRPATMSLRAHLPGSRVGELVGCERPLGETVLQRTGPA